MGSLRLAVASAAAMAFQLAASIEPEYVWQLWGTAPIPRSVAFSHAGDKLAVSQVLGGYAIKVWNASTGAPIRTLSGSGHQVQQIKFSPDDQYLAAACHDFFVRVWRVSDGSLVRVFPEPYHTSTVGWTADGTRILSGNLDRNVRVYSFATGQLLRTIFTGAENMDVSNDGQRFVSGNKVYNVEPPHNPVTLSGVAQLLDVTDVRFSPDGQSVAMLYGYTSHQLRCFNSFTGQQRFAVPVPFAQAIRLEWTPNGQEIATTENRETAFIRIWNAATGAYVRAIGGVRFYYIEVGFSPDGARIAGADYDGQIPLHDYSSGALVRHMSTYFESIEFVAHSPDGNTFLAHNYLNTVLRRSADGSVVRSYSDITGRPSFSPDGTLFAARTSAGPALLRISDGQRLRLFPPHTANSTNYVAVSPDNSLVACAGGYVFTHKGGSITYDPTVRVYRASDGALVFTGTHSKPVNYARFSSDGARLVAGSADGFRIYNTQTWSFIPVATPIRQIDVSSAGNLVATADHGTVRVWHGGTGMLLRAYPALAYPVESLSFSRAGGSLAAATRQSYDGPSELVFFDLHQGPPTIIDENIGPGINCVDLSPNGRHYVIGRVDNSLCRAKRPLASMPVD